jgi:hypothetical protein
MRKSQIALAIARLAAMPAFFGDDDPPKIPDELKATVDAMIAAAVAAETTGLKAKNTELLGEVRGLKDKVKTFDGLDPVAVKALLDKFSNDEEAALIAKGKIDEVLKNRTERLNADWEKKLKAANDELTKSKEVNSKLTKKATNEAIIKAATKAGAEPTAMDDIILRAQSAGWTINEEGEVIARNGEEVIFGKDGKTPLSPSEWAESLRETAPHLWPRAQGSGASGSQQPSGKAGKIDPTLSPEARLTQARQGQKA